MMLDREIERGVGEGMDPLKLADELFQRAESRKVCLMFARTRSGSLPFTEPTANTL